MARPSTLGLNDRASQGALIPLLLELADEGMPAYRIAAEIFGRLQVIATPTTVRNWIRELDQQREVPR
jgi:hypothetical protein